MNYEVALDAFHGPLDLLLYLVKRNEVDVRDIPVAKVAEQFLAHLDAIQAIDVEWAGDFLVMAATLLEVKSKLLLPVTETTTRAEEADPRRELVKQLLEYRKAKDGAAELEKLSEKRQFLIPRTAPDDEEGATSPRLRRVELWDLVSAFGRLIRETQTLQPMHLVADDTPQSVYQDQLRTRLRTLGRIPFHDLFEPPYHRTRLIGYFLALLELIRWREVGIERPEGSDELVAYALPVAA
jgi:segregation and condensation protein A